MADAEKTWTKIAKDQLLGRKIVKVRYLTQAEMEELGWYRRCIVMQLDDGNIIYPSWYYDGNNAGALFTNNTDQPVIPVL